MSVLVIGDTMLDEDIICRSIRLSPEAPVPVLEPIKYNTFLGGAANVAANIRAMCNDVYLTGSIGADSDADTIMKHLNDYDIIDCLSKTNSVTLKKQRYKVDQHQVIRIDNDHLVKNISSEDILKNIKNVIDNIDVIVLSDYQKGTFGNIQSLIQMFNSVDIKIFVDPKSPDFSIYSGAFVITPNKNEYIQATGLINPTLEKMVEEAQHMICEYNIQHFIITLGGEGCLHVSQNEWAHYTGSAVSVYDVTGAGDTFIAGLVSKYVRTGSLDMEFANTIASKAVQFSGTFVPASKDHNMSLDRSRAFKRKRVSAEKKIVFTNGCFDILHAGHIDYLNKAKALGDFLIVGINSDASVNQIKGKLRPINILCNRIKMLEALSCVDSVIEFDDKTPLDLIKDINPDVLVKGGDYNIKEIVGYEYVSSYGGIVTTIPIIFDISTTKILSLID